MKFIVLSNKTAHIGRDFQIHKVGCRDISRKVSANQADAHEIEGTDIEDAIAQELEEYHYCQQGYERESYEIAPCLKTKGNEP